MNLTSEQLKAVEDMAYRLIPPNLTAINIEVDEYEFIQQVRTVGTPAHNAYYKGYVKQLIETRESIIKAAHNGSNPAQQDLLHFMADVKQHIKYE